MLLTKDEILARKAVAEMLADSQYQPAGVDLTLKEVHEITSAGAIDFDNSKRKLSETRKLEFSSDGSLLLSPGCYKIIYNEYVNIPDDCAAMGLPRSSLLRCGADVHCALWDPGYHGRSESLLTVYNAHGITLHKNAKVVQLIFVKLSKKAAETYSGQYKGENAKK
jgi:dUTP pyrophosphatase